MTKSDRLIIVQAIKSSKRKALIGLRLRRMKRLRTVAEMLGLDKKTAQRIIHWHYYMTNIDDRRYEPPFPQFVFYQKRLYISQKAYNQFKKYVKWLYNYMAGKPHVNSFIIHGRRPTMQRHQLNLNKRRVGWQRRR